MRHAKNVGPSQNGMRSAADRKKLSLVKAAAARGRETARKAAAIKAAKVPLASTAARDARRVKAPAARLTRVAQSSDMAVAADRVRSCGSNTLVLVHSTGCGHCLRMRPAFDVASKQLLGSGVQVIEVDSGAMGGPGPLVTALGDGFVGVPHIVLFGPAAAWKRTYNGDRSAPSLVAFARPY
jgi:hypothetical protein